MVVKFQFHTDKMLGSTKQDSYQWTGFNTLKFPSGRLSKVCEFFQRALLSVEQVQHLEQESIKYQKQVAAGTNRHACPPLSKTRPFQDQCWE